MDDNEYSAKLNLETGRISWNELLPHFARGVVIKVASGLDLVAVASCFARDDASQVAAWLEQGGLAQLSDEDARIWTQQNPSLWAVVTAPWVLVQQPAADASGKNQEPEA